MTGDGTNDAPALAQADVGMAMNTGTQAAKEAGNMIDLDSDPTKLLEVVEVGKQLLMTRGALTTFSIANDVAKYFAILPAMFIAVYPEIAPLNIMGLASPRTAILSAVIFNALIIVLLIPLALKGVRYRPLGAALVAAPASALWPGRPHRPAWGIRPLTCFSTPYPKPGTLCLTPPDCSRLPHSPALTGVAIRPGNRLAVLFPTRRALAWMTGPPCGFGS
jgi:hypothetical protein